MHDCTSLVWALYTSNSLLVCFLVVKALERNWEHVYLLHPSQLESAWLCRLCCCCGLCHYYHSMYWITCCQSPPSAPLAILWHRGLGWWYDSLQLLTFKDNSAHSRTFKWNITKGLNRRVVALTHRLLLVGEWVAQVPIMMFQFPPSSVCLFQKMVMLFQLKIVACVCYFK